MIKYIPLIAVIIFICSCSKEPYDPDYNISLVVQEDSVTLYHHYKKNRCRINFQLFDEILDSVTFTQENPSHQKKEQESELIVLPPLTFSISDSAGIINYFESFKNLEGEMIKERIWWIGSQSINIEVADTTHFPSFFPLYRWVEKSYGSGFSHTGAPLRTKINGIQPYRRNRQYCISSLSNIIVLLRRKQDRWWFDVEPHVTKPAFLDSLSAITLLQKIHSYQLLLEEERRAEKEKHDLQNKGPKMKCWRPCVTTDLYIEASELTVRDMTDLYTLLGEMSVSWIPFRTRERDQVLSAKEIQ